MAEIQELMLRYPDMIHDFFWVKIEGKDFQAWEKSLYVSEDFEFYLEGEDRWQVATVGSWYIPDGSGNAPGSDSHFFAVIRRSGKTYKYDLHEDLRVRLEAPTHEELVASPKWCEEPVTIEEATRYNPPVYGSCFNPTKRYVAPSGQMCWYCDKHKPTWLTVADAS